MHNRYFIDYQFDERTKEFHQRRVGCRGMRGLVNDLETYLGYYELGKQTLQSAINREADVTDN